jgi:OOP family OmpA-OmpF porin
MKVRFIWLAFLLAGFAQAQEMELKVELMNRVGTETSRKGDLVSARVLFPAGFQGSVVEGKIAESTSGARSRGQSVLDIDFDMLRHNGTVTPINSRIKSIVNSKGQANVDEEGRLVGRSGSSNRSSGTSGLGRTLGGIVGSRASQVGAAVDDTTSAVIRMSADAPNLRFDAGSKFVLTASSRSGPALASLASSKPTAASTPATAAIQTQSSPAAAAATTAQAATGQPEMTTLKSTFIPGEKTIFYDDFTDMGPDDAPPHFKVRGAATELRSTGNVRQLTVIQGGTILSPNLTALPANFTYEAEMAFETGTNRATSTLVFYSKNKEVFRLDFYASEPTSDLVASMRAPYSELGRKRFNTKWNEPGKLALWIQNGRMRIFVKDEKQLDFNQVEMPPIDKVEFQHSFSGANAKSIGYRVVRFAESTPDFSQVISSSGRYVTHGILFDTDSDRLKPESAPVIQLIARGLETNPNLKLLIEGHTDSVGNADHNMDLSRRRAEAVKSVLVSQFNTDPARLSTAGLGATKPIDSNDTPQGRSQNRRVELVKQ